MKRFTEKTIRDSGKWCKITRDNQKRDFTFALGDDGIFTAYYISTVTFKWCTNWTEAKEKARYMINNL